MFCFVFQCPLYKCTPPVVLLHCCRVQTIILEIRVGHILQQYKGSSNAARDRKFHEMAGRPFARRMRIALFYSLHYEEVLVEDDETVEAEQHYWSSTKTKTKSNTIKLNAVYVSSTFPRARQD